jgi:4'-phosphopantetheinyl transferase EntD
LRDACGAPVWPRGFVGSITHTGDIAAAVVSRSPPVRGLGLDVENDEPLEDAGMVAMVCRPEELLPGRHASHPSNRERAKLLFVVKEAVYKLYRPLNGAFLDFHDVRVILDESNGAFRAELVEPRLPPVAGRRMMDGSFARIEGLFVALASQSDADAAGAP